jgi:NAD(P)H-dependent FMN reductase
MSTLQVIVGSTRADRAADKVVPWILDRAGRHPAFAVDLLDLRDWPLPLFQETFATIGDPADPTYSEPIVREWNRRVKQGDAFLIITPEYNHSVPAVLKNAIDSVFVSYAFRNKPAAMVGYSGGNVGGARAVEHLAHILIEAECVPLRNSVLVGGVNQAFDADGEPVNPLSDTALEIALDDLAWWTAALETARAAGQLLPGNRRMGAAMAALAR